jgi:hypothetical protein
MKNDGGAAFPAVGMSQSGDQQFLAIFNGGMSLRAYFAGQALQGLLPNHAKGQWPDIEPLANWAVLIADAMIAELERE